MSCIRFNTAAQRKVMRENRPLMVASEAPPTSQHPIPAFTEAKLRRLGLLAADRNPKIRESVASSPYLTPDLVVALSRDEDEGVRSFLARNERTNDIALRLLARDESDQVRGFVALNRAVPADVLTGLANDASSSVRNLVQWRRAARAE